MKNQKEEAKEVKQTSGQGKKRSMWIGLSLGAFAALALAVVFKNLNENKLKLEEQSANLELELKERDSAYNEVVDVIYAVEEQIEMIKARENLITNTSMEYDYDDNVKGQLVRDMRAIDSLILHTNRTVSRLMANLESANMDLKSFKNRVNRLSQELEQRKAEFLELKKQLGEKDSQIAEMNFSIQKLEDEIHTNQAIIENQLTELTKKDDQLHQAFLAIDSKKSLLEHGVVEKDGGFLWFGRSYALRPDAAPEYFSTLDTRINGQVPVMAKDVELITEHPEGSYQIIREGDTVKMIAITDPDNFWRVSKYLVVAVEG